MTPLDRKLNPCICDCQFMPFTEGGETVNDPGHGVDASYHYLRECNHCKYKWYSLRCPHDGGAITCPECKKHVLGLVEVDRDERIRIAQGLLTSIEGTKAFSLIFYGMQATEQVKRSTIEVILQADQ